MNDETERMLRRCKEERKSEFDRYYQTVMLTLGVKTYIDGHAKDCRFSSAESRFFVENSSSEIRPDIILQYGNRRGILCEVKTSFPSDDVHLLQSLKQIEKYSQNVVGWDSADRKVDDHDIILFCYIIDSERVSSKIQEWLGNGSLNISKSLCVCEWGTLVSPKIGRDIILIRKRFGNINCEELNNMLQNSIIIDQEMLTVEYEKCKFTRRDPPVEYTMSELWVNVFPAINAEPEDFETVVEEVFKIAREYYISWAHIEGEFTQIRKRWIKRALDSFCEIGLAEQISEDSERYRIFRSKQIQKDLMEYIIESLCNKRVHGALTAPFAESKGTESQKSILSF